MKNANWRRVALVLGLIVACSLFFGAGVAIGAQRTAEFLIEKVVQVMGYEGINIDISRAELLEYYIKLKGGM